MIRFKSPRRVFEPRVLAVTLGSAVITFMLSTGILQAIGRTSRAVRPPQIVRTTLSPISTARGVTGRTLLRLPAGDCVVQHFPVEFFHPDEVLQSYEGDTTTTADDLVPYIEPLKSRWHISKKSWFEASTFNCATYALGDSLGLTKSDWLGTAADPGEYCPTEAVLRSYYQQIASFPMPDVDWSALETLVDLRHDDVISFVRWGSASRNSPEPEHFHLGRLYKRAGRNLMVSKLGSWPIGQGTIEATARHYKLDFDEIRVYRRLPANSTSVSISSAN